jgi:hypothetical protein
LRVAKPVDWSRLEQSDPETIVYDPYHVIS